MSDTFFKELVSMCKRRGFIFPGSEIYGGLANTFDFGPYGAQLKKNLKDHWWRTFVTKRRDMVGLDAAILMHPKTWEASGHVGGFSDPLIDCKACKARFRVDTLVEEAVHVDVEGKTSEEMAKVIGDNNINCPNCGKHDWTMPRQFNLMFKTAMGTEDTELTLYLRPETAQGIFVNFQQVVNSVWRKPPFGIAQIGKAFRNEIVARHYIFRTREFEQMEIEYFCAPEEVDEYFEHWLNQCKSWYSSLGLKSTSFELYEHPKEKLAHYSKRTIDLMFKYPFGTSELMGLASRSDFDLKSHEAASGESMSYLDQRNDNRRYIPHVIEPSFGVERAILAFLCDAFVPEEALPDGKTRAVLKLHKDLAPIQIAILPLARNKPDIVDKAYQIYDSLSTRYLTMYDDTGAIGKLYRRQDEVGTPYCITVDYETIESDGKVTVRDRDSMTQERIAIDQLHHYFTDQWAK